MTDNSVFDQLDGDEPEPAPETALGLELDYDRTSSLGVPLECLVIAKTLDEGDFGYRILSSKELNTVEGLGMIRWAQLTVERGMFATCEDPESNE